MTVMCSVMYESKCGGVLLTKGCVINDVKCPVVLVDDWKLVSKRVRCPTVWVH